MERLRRTLSSVQGRAFAVGFLWAVCLFNPALRVGTWQSHVAHVVLYALLAYWAFRGARWVWRRTAGQKAEVVE